MSAGFSLGSSRESNAMNAERLHSVLRALSSDFKKQGVAARLNELRDALKNVVNQSNATHQTNLKTAVDAVRKSLEGSTTHTFGPAWRQIIEEIGGARWVASSLLEELERILGANQITPAGALEPVTQLAQEFAGFESATSSAIKSFKHLKVGREELPPGAHEIGILVPRSIVNSDLSLFAKELKDIGFILRTFSELVTGTPGSVELRRLSSSDYLLDLVPTGLGTGIIVTAAFAKSVNWMLDAYQKVLNIKETKKRLAADDAPKEVDNALSTWAEDVVSSTIEARVDELMQEYASKHEKGRAKELHNAVDRAMRMIIARIDRGFGFEARAQLPTLPEDGKNGEGETAPVDLHPYEELQVIGPKLRYLRADGDPILALPPSLDEEPETSERDASGRRRKPGKD